jgi:hypothetical protein
MNEKKWADWYMATRDRLLLRAEKLHNDAQTVFQKGSKLSIPADKAEVKALATLVDGDAQVIDEVRNLLEGMAEWFNKLRSLDEQIEEITKALVGINEWKKEYAQPLLEEAEKDYSDKLGKVTKIDKPK